jgi:hypothetical protein
MLPVRRMLLLKLTTLEDGLNISSTGVVLESLVILALIVHEPLFESLVQGASPIVAKNQFHRNSRVSFLSATSMASM